VRLVCLVLVAGPGLLLLGRALARLGWRFAGFGLAAVLLGTWALLVLGVDFLGLATLLRLVALLLLTLALFRCVILLRLSGALLGFPLPLLLRLAFLRRVALLGRAVLLVLFILFRLRLPRFILAGFLLRPLFRLGRVPALLRGRLVPLLLVLALLPLVARLRG